MSWLSKTFHKVTHAVSKVVKTVAKPALSLVGGLLGGSSSTTQSPSYQIAAPAVAAPEPTQGQEESDLVSKRKRSTNKGKRALLINTGSGGSSGGSTSTGLNL